MFLRPVFLWETQASTSSADLFKFVQGPDLQYSLGNLEVQLVLVHMNEFPVHQTLITAVQYFTRAVSVART